MAKKKAQRPSTKQSVTSIRAAGKKVAQALKPSIKAGKIDYRTLLSSGTPLAEVMDVIVASKTTRDDPQPVIKDVSRLLAARQSGSRFAKSVDALARMLAKPVSVAKKGKQSKRKRRA
jgi:hypothetical protein